MPRTRRPSSAPRGRRSKSTAKTSKRASSKKKRSTKAKRGASRGRPRVQFAASAAPARADPVRQARVAPAASTLHSKAVRSDQAAARAFEAHYANPRSVAPPCLGAGAMPTTPIRLSWAVQLRPTTIANANVWALMMPMVGGGMSVVSNPLVASTTAMSFAGYYTNTVIPAATNLSTRFLTGRILSMVMSWSTSKPDTVPAPLTSAGLVFATDAEASILGPLSIDGVTSGNGLPTSASSAWMDGTIVARPVDAQAFDLSEQVILASSPTFANFWKVPIFSQSWPNLSSYSGITTYVTFDLWLECISSISQSMSFTDTDQLSTSGTEGADIPLVYDSMTKAKDFFTGVVRVGTELLVGRRVADGLFPGYDHLRGGRDLLPSPRGDNPIADGEVLSVSERARLTSLLAVQNLATADANAQQIVALWQAINAGHAAPSPSPRDDAPCPALAIYAPSASEPHRRDSVEYDMMRPEQLMAALRNLTRPAVPAVSLPP